MLIKIRIFGERIFGRSTSVLIVVQYSLVWKPRPHMAAVPISGAPGE